MLQGNFVNLLILMAMAVVLLWLFRRIKLPTVLAYLTCGVLAGPEVLQMWQHPDEMHTVAELGIVFLLFSLGLEFSLPRMVAMRHQVFGIGLGQTLVTGLLFMGIAWLLGFNTNAALVIGFMVALSSTAVVIKQSSDLGILNTNRAQISISILLFQDLAVVPLLIIIPLLSESSGMALFSAISLAVLKGALVLFLLLSAGKWILPRIFNEVARTRTDELFVMTTLLVTLIAAGLTYSFGLSMALGAFLAGMMLGESQYRHQLEADIRPFRDILMGLFFITIGMQLTLDTMVSQWHWALLGLVAMVVLKTLVIRVIAGLYKTPPADAWASGIKLCQMGEFSFVIAALANSHGIITAEQQSLLLGIGVISMAFTPYLVENSYKLAQRVINVPEQCQQEETHYYPEMSQHVLIFGFGRVGQSVSRLLKMEGIKYVVIDFDPIRVKESRSAGVPIYYGDVRQKDILRGVGIEKARLAIITFDQYEQAINVIHAVKEIKSDLPVVVRTRKDYHLEALIDAGATQVVPEILEGSLMLVSQVMHLCGVPMSRILKRVRSERKGHYGHMHGFFPGETTEISYGSQDKLEFMHAVVLTPDSHVVGMSVADVDWDRLRIRLAGLRRNNDEIAEPEDSTLLKVNDVVVISGKPRRVERAERFLLEGD